MDNLTDIESDKTLAKRITSKFILNVCNIHEVNLKDKRGVFINMFNNFYFKLENFDLKQGLLRDLDFIPLLFDLLEYSMTDFSVKFNRFRMEATFPDYLIFGKFEHTSSSKRLSRDLCLKVLLILTFICLENDQNQIVVRDFVSERGILLKLSRYFFEVESIPFYRIFINFLTGIYCKTLQILLDIPLKDPEILQILMENLMKDFDSDKITLQKYYLFMSLSSFTSYKGIPIERNCRFLLDMVKGLSI